MLDCTLDLTGLLHFFPLPLVHSWKLSSLPSCKLSNDDKTTSSIFRDNAGHVFVDSVPLVRLPETGLVDVSMVDILLVSNCFSMLALPYLVKEYNFKGKVFATEPTKQLGKQLMEELCEYIHRTPVSDRSQQWRDEEMMRSLPDCALKEAADFLYWKTLYKLQDVYSAISLIEGVSYGQKNDLFGSLEVTAVSSGYCLGSCNWVMETKYSKFAYVSSSSTFTTHPCPMERAHLQSCDVLIISSLTNAPSVNPDTMLGELCTRMATTLKNGGNILIPCYPTGVIYDLLECFHSFLENAGLGGIPVYFISPVAKSSLSFSNIYAEWLCEGKQSKVYLPEHPFPHAEFLKSGRLQHFPNIHGDLGSVYQTPCVVFTGHPSLRCGDAVHFMEVWGTSGKNAVIFIEPGFDYLHALAPYQPINMKAFYFPIDPGVNFFVANKLLKELQPRCLVTPTGYLPSSAQSQKETTCLQPEMIFHGVTRGSVVSIPLASKYHKIQITPELAGSLLPQEIHPGILATTVSGLLTIKSGQNMLHPLPHPSAKRLWGQTSPEKLVSMLQEQGIMDVVVQGRDKEEVITILGGKASVIISNGQTTVQNCHDEKLRVLLRDLLLRQLIQL